MLTDINPFVYSHPLAPEDIIDRDDETRALLPNAVGGHFVRLYAPRKYGKTSLLQRVLRDGEREEGLIPVLVDLYRVVSVADVTVRLERAYARHLKGAVRARVDQFLQRTGIGLSLGVTGSARVSSSTRRRPAACPARPARPAAAARAERRLPRADRVRRVPGHPKVPDLDGLIRSHIQYHGEVASYVFAGSEPGLMEQLFETRDRPLYGSAVPMRLGRLARRRHRRIRRRAVRGDRARRRGGARARCCRRRRAIRSARCCSRTGSGRGRPRAAGDPRGLVRAYEAALAELDAEFDAEWRHLDTSEQKTLRSVLEGDGSPYRGDVLKRLALTKDMVRKALPRLAGSALTERNGDRHEIVDPLFAEWIRRGADPPE